MRASVLIASLCFAVAGCSPSEPRIQPIYVAPHQYSNLGCDEIAGEAQRVAQSAAALAGAPAGSTQGGEKVITWPSLASAKNNDETKSALGRLKGEFDALVLAASMKNCGLQFQQGSA